MTTEIDDLKLAWTALDRRMQALDASLTRTRPMDPLRALRRGQSLQLAFGALLAMWAGGYWTSHQRPALVACGVALHLYGVLIVALSIGTLSFAHRVRMSDPLVEAQARLLALSSWRLRAETLVLAMAGCFAWIPALVIAFAAVGVELAPAYVLSLLGSGLVTLGVVLACARLVRSGSTSRLATALRQSALGSSIARAAAQLDAQRAELSE